MPKSLVQKITDKLPNIVQDAADVVLPSLPSGEKLINAFGLNKFKHIWIQKIIDSSIPIYLITVDSRRPSVYLSLSKLKRLQFAFIKRIKVHGKRKYVLKNSKLTTPIPLKYFNRNLSSSSIVFFRDLAGEYFLDQKMYESVRIKIYNL